MMHPSVQDANISLPVKPAQRPRANVRAGPANEEMHAMTYLNQELTPESSAPTAALGVVMFVICFALFIGGLYLMAIAFDDATALLFVAGLITSGLAFVIPLQLLPEMD